MRRAVGGAEESQTGTPDPGALMGQCKDCGFCSERGARKELEQGVAGGDMHFKQIDPF